MQNLLLILRLIWSPQSLAQVAMQTSNAWAIPFSSVVIALELGTFFGMATGGLYEPYVDFAYYLEKHTGMAIVSSAAVFVCFLPWVILFVAKFKDTNKSRWAAECRVIILIPICFILPMLVCSFSNLLALAQASASIVKPPPPWVMLTVFQFIGSPWWLLVIAVFGLLYCNQTVQEVRRTFPTPDSPNCTECGYILRGLPKRRCPECGKEF